MAKPLLLTELLTEFYKRAGARNSHDPRHPQTRTVERHVVSFNGEIRLFSSTGKGETCDVFEEIKPIFDECAISSKQTTFDPIFTDYRKQAAETDNPVMRKQDGQPYDVYALGSRIVATFSDPQVAKLFEEKIIERTSVGRMGNVDLRSETYHVPQESIQIFEHKKLKVA
jgi:hypothetical protein